VKWVCNRLAPSASQILSFPLHGREKCSDDADQLDNAGQTILKLLHKAASVAEANSQHALEMAQKLSRQLSAAENRIAELEAEVELYR
jgi:hypothetical protein